MIDKRISIFQDKWFQRIKESSEIKKCEVDGFTYRLYTNNHGILDYNLICNIVLKDNEKVSDSGLKWLIKNLNL